MKITDRITAVHILAMLMLVFTFGLFYIIIIKGTGGNEAVFAILGYVAGWVSSVILFLYPKQTITTTSTTNSPISTTTTVNPK